MTSLRCRFILAAAVLIGEAAFSQPPQPGQNPTPNPAQSVLSIRPDYELGPNDQILIIVPQSQEINQRPFRIDSDGNIELPLVGKLRAAGLTVRGLENVLTVRLREFIRDPIVSISPVQFRSETAFFLGAFARPGLYTLQGSQTLVEMLAFVGGLAPTASRRIKVTRRSEYGALPLPNAVVDPSTKSSSVEISIDSLTQNVNPAEDLILKAYDIVNAETALPVYVNGEVTKPGPILAGEQQSISVTQALSQAGGFTQFATRGKIRVLRPILGTSRRAEIEINMDRVFAGKDNDFPLLPNDVLYVPRANSRIFWTPVGTSFLTTAPTVLVALAAAGAL